MRQRAFWLFVALFVALIAATGAAKGGSGDGRTTAASDPWAGQDQWIEQARRNDPFVEMLELQKRLDSELDGREMSLFGRSWNDWFGEGMDLAAIQEKTRETGREVVVELKLAGLDKDSLDINVDGSRIRVAYDARKVEDKQDGSGREIFKSESIRHFEKIVPIPANADPRRSRIERDGDAVKIIFPKKEGSVKADA